MSRDAIGDFEISIDLQVPLEGMLTRGLHVDVRKFVLACSGLKIDSKILVEQSRSGIIFCSTRVIDDN